LINYDHKIQVQICQQTLRKKEKERKNFATDFVTTWLESRDRTTNNNNNCDPDLRAATNWSEIIKKSKKHLRPIYSQLQISITIGLVLVVYDIFLRIIDWR